jgi:hypothetical protein
MHWILIALAFLSWPSVATAQTPTRATAGAGDAELGAHLGPPYVVLPIAPRPRREPFDPELAGLSLHELRQLRYRVDVRGAVTVTCVSAAITLAGAIAISSEMGQRWERDQGVLVGGAIAAAVGGAGLIPSAFWLGHAAHRRRHLSRAIRDRVDRPRLHLAIGPRNASLSIEGRF